jgi:hypothetical protein
MASMIRVRRQLIRMIAPPLIFSNKQVWASRALALDGKGRVGAGTVNGRILLETVDPSILAGIGCSLIEATTSGESHWAAFR